MKPTLLILAAGMGSRYGGLKQLDPVGPSGETIMDYSVYDALRAGFGKVVFVIRRDFEDEFKRSIGGRYAGSVEVEYAFQRADDLPGDFRVPEGRVKPWGTGQAVYAARDIIREPFAAINADDFYGAENFRQLAGFLHEAPAGLPVRGALCAFRLDQTLSTFGTVSRGICRVDAAGNLQSVREHTRIAREDAAIVNHDDEGAATILEADTPVSMNSWAFPASVFGELERCFLDFLAAHGMEMKSEFYIPLVADTLIREGRGTFKMLTTPDRWYGVTYREDKPETVAGIAALIRRGIYPERLFA